MTDHQVVSHETWVEARKALLQEEKDFTRLRDSISRKRRELPWERVDTEYVFDGPDGQETLSDLFAGRNQLITYHFMYGPDWTEGCPSCSLFADHYNPIIIHLQQRDVTFVTVSRAPLAELDAYQQRMRWDFKWVSSLQNDFNFDYHVSFTPEEMEQGEGYYNYRPSPPPGGTELPGMSVFVKDDNGDIFHTYSTYARGLDLFLGVYNLLDTLPKGRDEADLPYGMAWLRRHDQYDS